MIQNIAFCGTEWHGINCGGKCQQCCHVEQDVRLQVSCQQDEISPIISYHYHYLSCALKLNLGVCLSPCLFSSLCYLYSNHNNNGKLLVKYVCQEQGIPHTPTVYCRHNHVDPGSSSALNDVYSNRSKIIQLIIVTSNPRHLESEFLSLNFISMANEQQNLLTETLFLKLSCTMWLKRNSKKEKSFHPLIKAALLQHSLASLLVRFQKLYNYIFESRGAESRV